MTTQLQLTNISYHIISMFGRWDILQHITLFDPPVNKLCITYMDIVHRHLLKLINACLINVINIILLKRTVKNWK